MTTECPDCTPHVPCRRHLIAALSTPRAFRCGCCHQMVCDCKIGKITDAWLTSKAYKGRGLICLKHYIQF